MGKPKNTQKKKPGEQSSKDEYTKKYERYLTNYTTQKTSLKSIVKHPYVMKTIGDVVTNVNRLRIHTYHFLKMYVLHKYNVSGKLPDIDVDLIECIMKSLCVKSSTGRPPSTYKKNILDELEKFHNDHYKKTMNDPNEMLSYTHLNTVLIYEARQIVTNFTNHISLHFYDFLNRFVNVFCYKEAHEKSIMDDKSISVDERKTKRDEFRKQLRRIKMDLLSHEDKCSSIYDPLKVQFRKKIIPQANKAQTLTTQVKSDPLYFLDSLIKMSAILERRLAKPINCFPLQKNITPKYVNFDTTTIIHLLMTNESNKSYYLTKGNTVFLAGVIWDKFFRTEKKAFKNKKYKFRYELMTDGYGCSILLIRNDLYKSDKKMYIPSMSKPFNYKSEKYVSELTDTEKESAQNKKIVGFDPGKDDLFYATDGIRINNTNEFKTFRYSQSQRKKETKSKKYSHIKEIDKKQPFLGDITVKTIEDMLTNCNFNSCNYSKVIDDIHTKNTVNSLLLKYYEKEFHRKLKFYSYINRQRSESWMINDFKEKFGQPEDVVACFGDWGQWTSIKYKEPTLGKGMRKIFRKAGYQTYLVDEYNTSKYNHFTGQLLEKFRKRGNPRPWMKDIRLWHGLLRSKSTTDNESATHMLVNRDFNGSYGIGIIAYGSIHDMPLPIHLTRQ
jgi:hypothetical protein